MVLDNQVSQSPGISDPLDARLNSKIWDVKKADSSKH